PVAYVHFFGFSLGGVEEIFNGDPSMLADMMVFYVAVLFFYLAGSALLGFGIKNKNIQWIIAFDLPVIVKILFSLVLFSIVLSKVLLYPEGVYSSYAFDSGAMASRV
ncbi:TPA: O-antigen polymerase, partial [Salmonella enterica]